MDEEHKKEFLNALNTYFKLKTSYENAYNKDKNTIIKKKGLSWKEKRREFAKLKTKCINCKRPVGTIFKTNVVDGDRSLTARCGDKNNPCPLNININLGYILVLSNELSIDEKKIEKTKKEIIIDKNDLLFGYTTSREAVEKFDKVKESYSTTSSNYEYFLQLVNDITDNKTLKDELKKEEAEAQLTIDNIKLLMKDYNKKNEVQFAKDAVELYVKELTPLLDVIMKKKYAHSAVVYDENDNKFFLIQTPISIEKLEYDTATKEHGVVSFRTGTEEGKRKAKTLKKPSEKKGSQKTKTKKVRKLRILPDLKPEESVSDEKNNLDVNIEEHDEDLEEASVGSDEDEESSKIRIYPELLPDGTIADSEAERLNYDVALENGKLIATNPNKRTEKYIVTEGK